MIDPGVCRCARLAEYLRVGTPLWSSIRSGWATGVRGGVHSFEGVTIIPLLSPDGPNLISTCMFSLIHPHTEEAARHYHAGKHFLSLDYANGKAHTNIKC